MTVQYSVARRTARATASETSIGTAPRVRLYTGAPPANCAAARTGTLIAEFVLPSDWASQASGVLTFSGTPLSATAVGAGTNTAGHYAIMDSAGTTCHEQGTVTITGGGGDMTVDNPSIANGQTVQITGWTVTEGNA